MAAGSNRFHVLWWALLVLLVAVRVPSVMQPAGADQALYAYVGQRILAGELPHRGAWDQKPPAVHVTYALMQAIWADGRVVAATDLVAAVATAGLLASAARHLTGMGHAGWLTAALYLLFANPSYSRLGGVRIRAQCETFIGLFVAGAVALLAWRLASGKPLGRREAWLAGLLVGVAATFKYNALVYGLPLLAALVVACWHRGDTWTERLRQAWSPAWAMALGASCPLLLMLAVYGAAGALEDLYLATITYNLQYSGETYASRWHMVQYLVAFPVRHARLDSLWMLGGAGTALLLAWSGRHRPTTVATAWVAAACLGIAINGSRGLPQYFVQAWPPLALAAGTAGALAWSALGLPGRLALGLALVLAVPRVTPFDKLAEATAFDMSRMAGRIDQRTYLARFGRADSGDKYSALAVHDLAGHLRANTSPADRVYVFGFSPWAYVGSERASASRFFWSRPVIIGFEQQRPGYGVNGLLAELRTHRPAIIALQARDWDPDGPNSLDFFLADPVLSGWLQASYRPAGTLHNFHLWTRADGP